MFFTGQSDRLPAAKGCRATAQVNSYVNDFALGNPDQFPLRLFHLVVQAAQNVSAGTRVIVLHKALNDSDFRHSALIVALEEKAALVAKYSRLQHKDARQRGRKLFY